MKKTTLILMSLSLFWSGCELPVEKDDQQATVSSFVLCEGNYGSGNAALWSITPDEANSETLILGGTSLGDVAQSLSVSENRLFTVVNNSHKIEIFSVEESIGHLGTIQFENASPRTLAVDGSTGYVSCWNLTAILILDLDNQAVVDTIELVGMPEDLILYDGYLYASTPTNVNWATENSVVKISTETHEVVESYETISGPSDMALIGAYLYVAGTYYGANWTTYTGLSKIDLINRTVTTNADGANSTIKGDLVVLDEMLYRLVSTGLAPVNNDLSLNMDDVIGNQSSTYSSWADDNYIYFGTTDYVAPDTVYVTDHQGNGVNQFVVGAIPGDFITVKN